MVNRDKPNNDAAEAEDVLRAALGLLDYSVAAFAQQLEQFARDMEATHG